VLLHVWDACQVCHVFTPVAIANTLAQLHTTCSLDLLCWRVACSWHEAQRAQRQVPRTRLWLLL
jgi:hypothetical protein